MLTQIVIGLEAAAGNAARKRDVSSTIKDNYASLKFPSIECERLVNVKFTVFSRATCCKKCWRWNESDSLESEDEKANLEGENH